jgi:hypothetical protein
MHGLRRALLFIAVTCYSLAPMACGGESADQRLEDALQASRAQDVAQRSKWQATMDRAAAADKIAFDARQSAEKARRDEVRREEMEREAARMAPANQANARASAEQSCKSRGLASACASLSDIEDRSSCLRSCAMARDEISRAASRSEQQACESRFVESAGKGDISCHIDGASPDADERATKDLYRRSVATWEGSALDEVMRRNDGAVREKLQSECTAGCRARGPDLLRLNVRGPSLVTAYKRCMVDADSTREARKLEVYESDLYCDYLRKANERCRAVSECDWMERTSTDFSVRCEYRSPGGVTGCLTR